MACAGSILAAPLSPPDLATCAAATAEIPGCATTCGENDVDWYRVGKLNNGQVLQASLDHDPSLGVLQLALVRLSNPPTGQPSYLRREFNTAGEAQIDISFTAPYLDPMYAREYALVVEASGAGAYQAQPYALSVFVGDPCNADTYEGDSGNESPAAASVLNRTPGTSTDLSVEGTLCGSDVDVYELFALTGEQVRVVLEGKAGMTVEIGSRPSNVGDPAVLLTCGAGVLEGESAPDGCTTPSAPDGSAAEGNIRVIAEATPDQSANLYLTVRSDAASGIGDYELKLEVTPAAD
jgi:hypothetical protein